MKENVVRYPKKASRRPSSLPALPLWRVAGLQALGKVSPTKAKRTAAKAVRPKKRVKFATTAAVQTRAISQEELKDTWYGPEEYARFENDRRLTICAMQTCKGDLKSLDSEQHCIRGLEQLASAKQVLARKYSCMQYTRMVLEEQYLQRCAGKANPDSLQAVSEMFSKHSLKRAYLRAVIDHALAA